MRAGCCAAVQYSPIEELLQVFLQFRSPLVNFGGLSLQLLDTLCIALLLALSFQLPCYRLLLLLDGSSNLTEGSFDVESNHGCCMSEASERRGGHSDDPCLKDGNEIGCI